MGEGRKYKYIQGSAVIKKLEEKYGKFIKTELQKAMAHVSTTKIIALKG